jgi:hypothetical protein
MFNFELTERGYLRKHESSDLEYKENFHRGDEMLRCQGDGAVASLGQQMPRGRDSDILGTINLQVDTFEIKV